MRSSLLKNSVSFNPTSGSLSRCRPLPSDDPVAECVSEKSESDGRYYVGVRQPAVVHVLARHHETPRMTDPPGRRLANAKRLGKTDRG